MHQFLDENKRYLQLLIVTLVVISIFALTLMNTGNIAKSFGTLISVLKPFIYGFVIAYLLMPLVYRFEKLIRKLCEKVFHRSPAGVRVPAIICVFMIALFCIALLLYAVIPGLVISIKSLVIQVPRSFREFEDWLERLVGTHQNDMTDDLFAMMEYAYNYVIENIQSRLLPSLENLASQLTIGFGGFLTILKNFGLGCIVAIYLQSAWEKFGAQARVLLYGLIPTGAADWIVEELKLADKLFGGFFSGKILDSAIIGVICFVAMILMNMPYAMLISVIVGITNIIPFFGPYIGAIPSAILVLTESPVKCLVFIGFILILQQIDGNVIGPKILGDKIGISSFWILFSILFFGSYWGVVGMIVGVPIFGLAYDLIKRIMHQGLKKHGKTELYDEYHREYEIVKEKPEKKRGKGIFGRVRK